MDLKKVKTTADNPDFKQLVSELDLHLTEFYGDKQEFFEKQNTVETIKNVIVIYDKETPVGCGGMKKYADSIMEIKRMYVIPEHRSKGIASTILLSLENWAKELGYSSTVLETMKAKKRVISMYSKNGYKIIPNYGQYKNEEKSVCMKKYLD